MSLQITRTGILDSIQDAGRHGFMHLGINPTGVMDPFSAALANILVGNPPGDAVVEIHFPASVFEFETPAIIALTGAHFSPLLHEETFPLNTPARISRGSTLRFSHPHHGARCYLAVAGGLDVPLWLHSASTHFKASAGGWFGRKLMKGDIIPFKSSISHTTSNGKSFEPMGPELKWDQPDQSDHTIMILEGNEYPWLKESARQALTTAPYTISVQSDRMGFKLQGPPLQRQQEEELISSPVTFGTLQLLPDGNLIILMADHQTTGGYPRVGHVISAHLGKLAQLKPGDTIRFQIADIRTAEQLLAEQHQLLEGYRTHYANLIHSFFEKID